MNYYALAARVCIWSIIAFFALGLLELVVWVIVVEVTKLLNARRTQKEFRFLLEREREARRVTSLRRQAQAIETARTRQQVAAEALGFCDNDAFLLDDVNQPRRVS
jgi:hypothetical protein